MEDTALVQQLLEWIQQQKPLYLAMKTATLTATDYVGFMVVQNWPIICSWLIYFGRLFLMLSQLWLECSLKGMGSLLHLGSTAYFVLLWCTVLSTTSISGLLCVIISLGIAGVMEPVLGFAPAIIMIAVSGATILWIYGSFWITGALITIGGSLLSLNHERLAILITTIYSMYLAKVRTGWVGLVFCINLAFLSNEILIYLLKSNGNENERKCHNVQDEETKNSARNFNNPPTSTSSNGQPSKSHKSRSSGESSQTGQSAQAFGETGESSNFNNLPRSTSSNGQPSKSHKSRPSGESTQTGHYAQTFGDSGESSQTFQSAQTFGETGERSQTFGKSGESSQTGRSTQTFGESSTARLAEADPSPGDEVLRILHSSDHYATLCLSRYENIDFVILKREYRKKAMLVHPDKNMGNVMAVESFKKLQSAYEVLSDLEKKNAYDEELRRDELTRNFHQKFQCGAQNNGRCNPSEYEREGKDIPAESTRIACRKCNKSHKLIRTNRAKCQARWCQDCENYHQAKHGDGWVELSDHIVFFGMQQKVEMQRAYACIENTIFDVSEWATCQGVNCRPNSHNPSFRVNGTITGNGVYWSNPTHKKSSHVNMATNIDEDMMVEDIFELLRMAFTEFDRVDSLQENMRMKNDYYGRRNLKRNGNNRW